MGTTCNGIEMPPDVPCLHNILNPYGYHTANLGKLHFKNHSNRDHREPHPNYGFDTLILSDEPGCYDDAYIKWVAQHDLDEVANCRVAAPPAYNGPPIDAPPRRTDEPYIFAGPENLTHSAFVAQETAGYIRARAQTGDPFFAIAGFYAPHAPLNPPARFVEMVDQDALPLPLMNEDDWNKLGHSPDHWRKVKAYYYALIMHVDDQIGRILAALEETGQFEDTLIIFTSDHGEHLGDHGIIAKGAPGYDSCAHIPLIVSWPGIIPGGQVRRELIEAVDIAPTVLDYAGVQAPPFFQGRSFRPLMEGKPYAERASVFIEYKMPFRFSWKTIRTQVFKYCVSGAGEELLFDLHNDPGELNNVAFEGMYEAVLHEMREEMVRRWFSVESQYPLQTGQY
jgi:arylsulfatase A-like enzyme